jgi:hypothetical protein
MDAKKRPYVDFERMALWPVLEKAIQNLSDNNDIKEQTSRNYIVGYLAKILSESGLMKSKDR